MSLANMSVIKERKRRSQYGMSLTGQSHYNICYTCVQMKHTKKASKRGLIDGSPNVTIHAGVCGPMQTPTLGERRYFLTLVTAPQRFVCVYLLKIRTAIAEYFYEYIACINKNALHKTKRVHTNNAVELLTMRRGLAKMNIELTTSTTYSPQSY